MYDNCTACEEKNRDLEYAHSQLDSIRLIVEDWKTRPDDVETICDNIMGILEG